MDRRQNNGSVKAVSSRHCPVTCALRNCCFNCCAWTESQRQCLLHRCWSTTWTTRSKSSSAFLAQLHLPTHDLFWAKLRVQLHLPPLRSLDLLILPGTPYCTLVLLSRANVALMTIKKERCYSNDQYKINKIVLPLWQLPKKKVVLQ